MAAAAAAAASFSCGEQRTNYKTDAPAPFAAATAPGKWSVAARGKAAQGVAARFV